MIAKMTDIRLVSQSWRYYTRHPVLIEYRRLIIMIMLLNLIIFIMGLQHGWWFTGERYAFQNIANMALANISLGILIRQQRVVNALFWLAIRIPTSWPLWIRWRAGKVFHFGGLHYGGTVVGTTWFGFLLWGMFQSQLNDKSTLSGLTLGISAVMVGLMLLMIVSAIGPVRAKFHNGFEKIHRFVGWAVLGLFWAHNVSIMHDMGENLIQTFSFWVLCLVTLSVISPWLTLKRVDVHVLKPSTHVALAHFDYGDTPFPGSSNAISRTPFGEYHSFANIPTPGHEGYRFAISRSGDWTARFIDNPPQKVWVKGITTSGVARIEVLFNRVVYVGTGSGIGPILPHLLARQVPCRLIWSTRSPRKTYGDTLVDEIEAHTEKPLIWNTDEWGKPDLSKLALQAVRESDAEAVIVISNQKLTRRVVHDMETLGIPAYGAIWDS